MGFLDYVNDALLPDAIFGEGAQLIGKSDNAAVPPSVVPIVGAAVPAIGSTIALAGSLNAAEKALGSCVAGQGFCTDLAAIGTAFVKGGGLGAPAAVVANAASASKGVVSDVAEKASGFLTRALVIGGAIYLASVWLRRK